MPQLADRFILKPALAAVALSLLTFVWHLLFLRDILFDGQYVFFACDTVTVGAGLGAALAFRGAAGVAISILCLAWILVRLLNLQPIEAIRYAGPSLLFTLYVLARLFSEGIGRKPNGKPRKHLPFAGE